MHYVTVRTCRHLSLYPRLYWYVTSVVLEKVLLLSYVFC